MSETLINAKFLILQCRFLIAFTIVIEPFIGYIVQFNSILLDISYVILICVMIILL